MVYTGKIPVYLSITSKRINNEIYKPFKRSGEEHLDIVLTVYNIQHCDTLSSHTLPGSLSAAQTDGPHSSSDTQSTNWHCQQRQGAAHIAQVQCKQVFNHTAFGRAKRLHNSYLYSRNFCMIDCWCQMTPDIKCPCQSARAMASLTIPCFLSLITVGVHCCSSFLLTQ